MDDFDVATSSENSSQASSRPRSSYGQDLEAYMEAMGRSFVPDSKHVEDLKKKLGALKMHQQN